MNLGERIYELRNGKNLSQGDLADALDVSRQSVSKWENNMAVPDLDKLIKLCDIFEISLDELTGRETPESKLIPIESKDLSITSNKIAGFVFLGITLLSAVFLLVTVPMALYLCIPLLICTVICFTVKKYVWYWCPWIIYLFIELWLGTGFAWEILHIANFFFIVIMIILNIVCIKDSNATDTKRRLLLTLSLFTMVICAVCTVLTTTSLIINEWIYSLIRTGLTASIGMSAYHIIACIRQAKK